MFYDFHIHSCLSPCSENDMTPNNIVNMALLKGLDMIAICDHNTTKQQKAIHEVAKLNSFKIMYGTEIQTIEEVHVCCYFKTLEDIENFQPWIDSKNMKIKNNEDYFGQQLILDSEDNIVGSEEYLLITSLNCTLNELCDAVHQAKGKVVLAHALDRANSITHQLGFIPKDCQFDGIEVKTIEQMNEVLKRHPWIQNTTWFMNSDAHQLIDISEPCNSMSSVEFQNFWG